MTEIRRAAAEDADLVVRALHTLYHREPPDIDVMADILANPNFLLLLATESEQCIGYLHGQTLHRLDGERMLLVYEIEVASQHRRRGIGTSLMDGALRYAVEAGLARCWLVTESDNRIARSFYESLDGEEWRVIGFNWPMK